MRGSKPKIIIHRNNDIAKKSPLETNTRIARIDFKKVSSALLQKTEDDEQDLSIKREKDRYIILQLLKKRVKKRNDIIKLRASLEKLPFFYEMQYKLSNSMMNELISELKLEIKKGGTVLFNFGDPGNLYYILIIGTVYLLLPKKGIMEKEKNDDVEKEEPQPSPKISSVVASRRKSTADTLKTEQNIIKLFAGSNLRRSFLVEQKNIIKEKDEEENEKEIKKVDQKRKHLTHIESPIVSAPNTTPILLSKSTINLEERKEERTKTLSFFQKEKEKPKEDLKTSYEFDLQKELLQKKQEESFEMDLNSFPHLTFVKKIESGNSFGEITLIDNSRRETTAVAATDCFMATLSKSSYEKIMGRLHQKNYYEKLHFLKSFVFFYDWQPWKISAILTYFEEKDFLMNQLIYKENDVTKCLYLIQEGEIEISQSIPTEEIDQFDSPFAPKIKYKKVKIAVIGPGNFFGAEEIYYDVNRVYRAVCKTKAHLFIISKEKFLSCIQSKFHLKRLEDETLKREGWRKNLVNQIFKTQNYINKKILNLKSTVEEDYVKKVYEAKNYNFEENNDFKAKLEDMLNNLQSTYKFNNNLEQKKKEFSEIEAETFKMRNIGKNFNLFKSFVYAKSKVENGYLTNFNLNKKKQKKKKLRNIKIFDIKNPLFTTSCAKKKAFLSKTKESSEDEEEKKEIVYKRNYNCVKNAFNNFFKKSELDNEATTYYQSNTRDRIKTAYTQNSQKEKQDFQKITPNYLIYMKRDIKRPQTSRNDTDRNTKRDRKETFYFEDAAKTRLETK